MSKEQNKSPEQITVVCRVRNFKDSDLKQQTDLIFEDENKLLVGKPQKEYMFNKVFGMYSKQEEIYEHTAKPIIDQVIKGINGTILVYGQSSSGKTHTMYGNQNKNNSQMLGIVPRMVKTFFQKVQDLQTNNKVEVKVSMLEIYNENIKDLNIQGAQNLKVTLSGANGVQVECLSEQQCKKEGEVQQFILNCNSKRATNPTFINNKSSRSHSIFILNLIVRDQQDKEQINSKLYMVDLAGSESVKKSGVTNKGLIETKYINKSIEALKKVFASLSNKQDHIPFRDSKLTRILSGSMGGDSKVCLIITCSPETENTEATVNDLKCGIQASKIQKYEKDTRQCAQPKQNKAFIKPSIQPDLIIFKQEAVINNQPEQVKELQFIQQQTQTTSELDNLFVEPKNKKQQISHTKEQSQFACSSFKILRVFILLFFIWLIFVSDEAVQYQQQHIQERNQVKVQHQHQNYTQIQQTMFFVCGVTQQLLIASQQFYKLNIQEFQLFKDDTTLQTQQRLQNQLMSIFWIKDVNFIMYKSKNKAQSWPKNLEFKNESRFCFIQFIAKNLCSHPECNNMLSIEDKTKLKYEMLEILYDFRKFGGGSWLQFEQNMVFPNISSLEDKILKFINQFT